MASSEKKMATYQYGEPTQAGKIPFTPPGTELKCETAYWLYGTLDSKTPPLIILHGGPGAPGRDWKVVSSLHKTHGIPILLYDQIGCGASTHLRDTRGDTKLWMMDLFFAELDNVKTHLKIETFDLAGHSCGGMIAASYALTQPKGLRKLIIASSPASEELRSRARIRQREALPQELKDAMITCEKEGRINSPEYKKASHELMCRHMCRLDPWPAELLEVFKIMDEDDTVPYTLYGADYLRCSGTWKDYDLTTRLGQITEQTVPGGVLLTNGKYDMVEDEGVAPFFTEIRARVKWIRFGESAHAPHLEEPQAYLDALGAFLTTE